MSPKNSNTADQCCQRLQWSDINSAYVRTLVELAKNEDLNGAGLATAPSNPGDHSSALLDSKQIANAILRAREPMTLCGVELAPILLEVYDKTLKFSPSKKDGDLLAKGDPIGSIQGPVSRALEAERPLLNFLQMLSGVATQTRKYVNALGNSPTRLLDTRKTTPGYRVLEKFAVACGGGWNHRIGLFDRVMLKDNHIAAFGSDPMSATIAAVSESRRRDPKLLIEMEVDSIEQIDIALAAKVDIILLDNFTPAMLEEAINKIDGQAVTEASGGITIESLPALSKIGVDFISTGALVHQSRWVDIGLDWE